MIDALNLDQLRVFTAIAERGSFTAAARHLLRAQSAISSAVVNLEAALGVVLFDRSGWKPVLTEQGQALLTDAKAVLARVDQLKSRAQGLTRGLEAELAVVLDVMYPTRQLVAMTANFRALFPSVALRLHVDALGGVPARVLSGECDLGVQGTLPDIPSALVARVMPEEGLTPVASPAHALAAQAAISMTQLREHTQIVLSDRSGATEGRLFSVYSEQQILTTDLGAKRAMLRAGLGWGFMPNGYVEEDLRLGDLRELALEERSARNRSMPLFAVHRRDVALGPAGRWVLASLVEPSIPATVAESMPP